MSNRRGARAGGSSSIAEEGQPEHSPGVRKVLLVNGWSDDNKGDAAIVQGFQVLMGGAAKRRGFELDLGIVSNFSKESEDFGYHYRHSKRMFKGGIFGAVIPTNLRTASGGTLGKSLRRSAQLLTSLVALAVPRSSMIQGWLSPFQAETLEQFRQASMVVSKGGHIYATTGSPLSLVGLYSNLYPLLLAQRLGIPTGIYAQSVGPVIGGPHRRLLASALARCKFVYVREEPSLDYVRALLPGNSSTKPELVWDTAFAVGEEPLPPGVISLLPSEFVAVTVRQWRFPYSPSQDRGVLYARYLEALATVIRRLVTDLGVPVVVVPQVIGPTELENDLLAGEQLAKVLAGFEGVQFLTTDFTAGQLRQLYSRASMLIGTRFHSVILALASLTPAIAISYHGFKTQGIMRMLDLSDHVLDIGELSPDELWSRVKTAYEARDEYRATLETQMPAVLRAAAAEADRAITSLAS